MPEAGSSKKMAITANTGRNRAASLDRGETGPLFEKPSNCFGFLAFLMISLALFPEEVDQQSLALIFANAANNLGERVDTSIAE